MLRQLLNWVRLRRLEDDFDRELSYHMDRRVDDLKRSGLSDGQARRHRFGGLPADQAGVTVGCDLDGGSVCPVAEQ